MLFSPTSVIEGVTADQDIERDLPSSHSTTPARDTRHTTNTQSRTTFASANSFYGSRHASDHRSFSSYRNRTAGTHYNRQPLEELENYENNYRPPLNWGPAATETMYCNWQYLNMLQSLEEKIDSKFSEFSAKLSNMDNRIKLLESAKESCVSSSPSSSDSSSSGRKRKKRSPSDLQHKIRLLHGSLDEETQLKCHESIDSEHNRQVVSKIVKELSGGNYTADQIRDGCRIYRKSLHEADKEKTDVQRRKMRIRSRQQRLFDRRNKVVSDKKFKNIRKYWDAVTPEMMTEEETGDEDNYIRHRPGWRATNFTKLIDLLDEPREGLRSLAKPRELGSPSTSLPPSVAKKWMVLANHEQPIEQDVEDETISELLAEHSNSL